MKKTAILLLLSMLLGMTAGCASDTPSEDTTAAGADTAPSPESVTETTEAAEPQRADAKDNLPADLTFNGATVNLLSMSEVADYDVWGEGEESADLLYQAVYSRNRAVEERLAVTLLPNVVSVRWQEYAQMMRNLVGGGDTTYDFFYTMGNASIQSGNDSLFVNLSDAKYLDFSQPWWWQDAMEELTLDGKTVRYLVGDISLSHYLMSGCTFFNKEIFEDALGDPDALYQLVLEGGWTVDKLKEYAQATYQDLNADGAVNEGDIYGSIIGNLELLKQLEYASDLERFTRDERGYIKLAYNEERAVEITEKLYSLLYDTHGVEYRSAYTASTLFADRSMTFFLERLRASGSLRDMENDYGIIPLPKTDDKQENYRTLIHNNSQYVVVPKTAENVDMSCAVIEAMCAESYRSVVEIFYEKVMKLKYSRDALSGQCIDLISQSARKNALYEYDGVFNCGTVISNVLGAGSTNFSSTFAKVKTTAEKVIAKYMEKFEQDLAVGN